MKYFIAFIISISIHLLVYFMFIANNNTLQENKSHISNKEKISNIKYIQLQPKIIAKKKTPKAKKTISKPKPKLKPKVIKPKAKIIKQKPKSKPIAIKKEKIVKQIQKKEVQKKPVKQKLDRKTQKLINLYGEDFDKFDKQTKLFLIKNIKDIGKITQRFLSYPQLSAQAGQEGVNIIEFVLHPNGSIKDVMVSKSSGYFMLDDNTMDTVYEAYEDYPRPKKPTLIKIFVKYGLTRR